MQKTCATFQVGVPGFLRGLGVGHQEFGGQLGFCSLILPAILLASNGFQVSKKLALDLRENNERLSPELKLVPRISCIARDDGPVLTATSDISMPKRKFRDFQRVFHQS